MNGECRPNIRKINQHHQELSAIVALITIITISTNRQHRCHMLPPNFGTGLPAAEEMPDLVKTEQDLGFRGFRSSQGSKASGTRPGPQCRAGTTATAAKGVDQTHTTTMPRSIVMS